MNRLGPGQLLDGKYQILRTLGEGGMGVVFEAHHLRLEQQVAVKCLLPALVDDKTLVARFEREARAAARLRSRHVVKILDVANDATNGMPYMVMELLHGHDLQAEAAASGGRIAHENLIEWICQVAGALAEAHEMGVVHRDLKPSNIFLCDEPNERIAKVLDFGIAKANAIVPGITYTTAGAGSICGTPHYMSPEQITAGEVDGRSDVWALSVVTYEMLAGKVPFDAQAFTALAVKIVNEHPVHLAKLRPDLPVDLCDAIMRGLHKDLTLRHQTMSEFASSIAQFSLRGEMPTWVGKPRQSTRRVQNPESTPRIDVSPTLAATSFPTNSTERKRGLLWGGIALAGVIIVGASALGAISISKQGRSTSTTLPSADPPSSLLVSAQPSVRNDPTAEPSASAPPAPPTSSASTKKVPVGSPKAPAASGKPSVAVQPPPPPPGPVKPASSAVIHHL